MKQKMLRGFGRIRLTDVKTKKPILERTMENQFCDVFRNAVLTAISDGSSAVSQAAFVALGTGGAVTGTSTALPNELATRVSASLTVSSSSRLRVTASYDATHNTGNISNMGIHNHSSNATLLMGNTFAASFAKASNQELSVTYDIIFSS